MSRSFSTGCFQCPVLAKLDDEAERREAKEDSAQVRVLQAATGWRRRLLEEYRAYLATLSERYADRGWKGQRKRFGGRTVSMNLRAADRFFRHLSDEQGLDGQHQIDQDALNRFVVAKPGYRDGLRSLVRYLNQHGKLFKKLRIETVTRELPAERFLDRKRYNALLSDWLQADDEELKEAIIGLMMLLYAQRPKSLVRLRLMDLQRTSAGEFRVLFGRTEIALAPALCQLLDRYLDQRQALALMEDNTDNDYLFPGRAASSHLKEPAVSYYLKKKGVTVETLFSSALYYAYLSSMRQPKVLVQAFGITRYTAVKYLNLIDPRLADEAEVRVAANG